MQKGYRFRLYPDVDQQTKLRKNIGCARKMYNELVNDEDVNYHLDEVSPLPFGKKRKRLTYTQIKAQFPYMKDVDNLALANAQMNYRAGRKRFFDNLRNPSGRKISLPKKKRKSKAKWSYQTNNQTPKGVVAQNNVNGSVRFSHNYKYIQLPKVGLIKVKAHRRLQQLWRISTVTITQERNGQWYISLLMEIGEITKPEKTGAKLGIDLGLKDFAITSDGVKYNRPNDVALDKKIRRAQRKLSRKYEVAKEMEKSVRFAANYQKQKVIVAKLKAKRAAIRKDFQHKLSWEIINNHDDIRIENLQINNMMKNPKLARAIQESAWYQFTTMLLYKANMYDKQVHKVSMWFASSQICNECDWHCHKFGMTTNEWLSVREWTCEQCGAVLDRDVNAARNIRDTEQVA
ncbi:RNA-guided endonuclease TnpB family protein [Pseudolactococcus insecticola]|uniref:Transposase n=1 Tax=Pseudolactococcus insecticola TaxID=2709158 RepID=A0A6A0B822_9LACT|nr:RNA-guided endonuclease TnpB family protein [Lactococcus insecticola]GFH41442.1 transposase [Lactococcus insecticola]